MDDWESGAAAMDETKMAVMMSRRVTGEKVVFITSSFIEHNSKICLTCSIIGKIKGKAIVSPLQEVTTQVCIRIFPRFS
jgi:hypothetical protein